MALEINDWTTARFEAIATLAMNGILANPATGGLPPAEVAKRAVENAQALDTALTTNATPVETQKQT